MTRLRPLLMLVALLLAADAALTGAPQRTPTPRADGRSYAIGSARFVRRWRRHCCNDGR
jgi:hypothetical protein